MSETRRLYLHTIDGKPATFDGEQISFVTQHPDWQDRPYPARPVASLRTIKAQQARAREYRRQMGFGELGGYGYVFVEVPA
jgi:hypothetical protein